MTPELPRDYPRERQPKKKMSKVQKIVLGSIAAVGVGSAASFTMGFTRGMGETYHNTDSLNDAYRQVDQKYPLTDPQVNLDKEAATQDILIAFDQRDAQKAQSIYDQNKEIFEKAAEGQKNAEANLEEKRKARESYNDSSPYDKGNDYLMLGGFFGLVGSASSIMIYNRLTTMQKVRRIVEDARSSSL